jgi:hypothetical protein
MSYQGDPDNPNERLTPDKVARGTEGFGLIPVIAGAVILAGLIVAALWSVEDRAPLMYPQRARRRSSSRRVRHLRVSNAMLYAQSPGYRSWGSIIARCVLEAGFASFLRQIALEKLPRPGRFDRGNGVALLTEITWTRTRSAQSAYTSPTSIEVAGNATPLLRPY